MSGIAREENALKLPHLYTILYASSPPSSLFCRMVVAMLWVLWGLNSFLQEGIGQLGRYRVVDPRLSNGLVLMVE